jgi:hypothetical protein
MNVFFYFELGLRATRVTQCNYLLHKATNLFHRAKV